MCQTIADVANFAANDEVRCYAIKEWIINQKQKLIIIKLDGRSNQVSQHTIQ